MFGTIFTCRHCRTTLVGAEDKQAYWRQRDRCERGECLLETTPAAADSDAAQPGDQTGDARGASLDIGEAGGPSPARGPASPAPPWRREGAAAFWLRAIRATWAP